MQMAPRSVRSTRRDSCFLTTCFLLLRSCTHDIVLLRQFILESTFYPRSRATIIIPIESRNTESIQIIVIHEFDSNCNDQTKWIVIVAAMIEYHHIAINNNHKYYYKVTFGLVVQLAIVLRCFVVQQKKFKGKQFVFYLEFDEYIMISKTGVQLVMNMNIDADMTSNDKKDTNETVNITNTVLIINLFCQDQLEYDEKENIKHSINNIHTNINCNHSNSDGLISSCSYNVNVI